MSKEQLQEVVTALPSYDDWRIAIASLDRAVIYRAETRNGTEVETLKGQLAVAEAKEAIVSPTNQLKIEIIEE